jgi:hypothetical protein
MLYTHPKSPSLGRLYPYTGSWCTVEDSLVASLSAGGEHQNVAYVEASNSERYRIDRQLFSMPTNPIFVTGATIIVKPVGYNEWIEYKGLLNKRSKLSPRLLTLRIIFAHSILNRILDSCCNGLQVDSGRHGRTSRDKGSWFRTLLNGIASREGFDDCVTSN